MREKAETEHLARGCAGERTNYIKAGKMRNHPTKRTEILYPTKRLAIPNNRAVGNQRSKIMSLSVQAASAALQQTSIIQEKRANQLEPYGNTTNLISLDDKTELDNPIFDAVFVSEEHNVILKTPNFSLSKTQHISKTCQAFVE